MEVLRRKTTSLTIRFSDDSAILLGLPGFAALRLNKFIAASEGQKTR